MFDSRDTWNVIYLARGNRSHPATSLNTSKYCACHEKWLSWWILVTYETSFTMRGATGATRQRHHTAPATKNDSHDWSSSHIWNVIYNARSNRMQQVTGVTLQRQQMLRRPRTMTFQNIICEKFAENGWNIMHDRSGHEPVSPQPLNTAPATKMKSDSWTWPNTAPATKSDT